jgi:hypothetical protein
MRAPRFLKRSLLRRLRVLRVTTAVPSDPLSPEYLYLVQQSKRVSLVQTLNAFRADNLLSWPFLSGVVLIKWLDLGLSNSLIRSLINEHDLLQRLDEQNVEKRH